jgi:hypothetical protein
MGVSLVLHPRNPYCPTVHINVRFFSAGETWWFGGGMDLTPYYGFEEDAKHFHSTCKRALDPFGAELYPKFKKNCDEYFYVKHRNEPRGIGGIFFDDLTSPDFAGAFALARSVGDHFITAYAPILERRRALPWSDAERAFQCYRRGRYVEFNLVQDRGTLFGLQSGGRTESILMSMPPAVTWRYGWTPAPGSPEAKLYTDFPQAAGLALGNPLRRNAIAGQDVVRRGPAGIFLSRSSHAADPEKARPDFVAAFLDRIEQICRRGGKSPAMVGAEPTMYGWVARCLSYDRVSNVRS